MKVLLAIDVQNDFCPGGSLAVPEGDQIIPVVNRLSEQFGHMILTQDWHPAGHSSFASSHDGKKPYETIEMPYGEQVLWPDHCVQNSEGGEFHPDLDTERAEVIIRKGFRKEVDSYSAFYENDHKTQTGLAGYLRERGFTDIYVCGLATDFCVRWSVHDGRKEGFRMHVVEDGTRGIDIDGSIDQAWREMKSVGAEIIRSDDISMDG